MLLCQSTIQCYVESSTLNGNYESHSVKAHSSESSQIVQLTKECARSIAEDILHLQGQVSMCV